MKSLITVAILTLSITSFSVLAGEVKMDDDVCFSDKRTSGKVVKSKTKTSNPSNLSTIVKE